MGDASRSRANTARGNRHGFGNLPVVAPPWRVACKRASVSPEGRVEMKEGSVCFSPGANGLLLALALSGFGCSSASVGPPQTLCCYSISGTGATEQCTWSGFLITDVKGAPSTCPTPDDPGATQSGSCPSEELFGCCLLTESGVASATCYYSSSTGAPQMSKCVNANGETASWVTTPPSASSVP